MIETYPPPTLPSRACAVCPLCLMIGLILLMICGAVGPVQAVPVQVQAVNSFHKGQPCVVVDAALAGAHLEFRPQGPLCQAQVGLTLSFRRADGVVVYEARWTQTLTLHDALPQASQQFYLHRVCLVPPGAYTLLLEAADLLAGPAAAPFLAQQPLAVRRPTPGLLALGDITLLEGPPDTGPNPSATKPYLQPQLPAGATTLIFEAPLLAPAGPAKAYTIRSILFRKAPEQESNLAQRYLSVLQQNQVQTQAAGPGVFRSSFMVEGLQPGDYLLEVYVFDGENIVAETARPLVLAWPGLGPVLADVDLALRQLEPIVGTEQVAQWLALPDSTARRAALQAFWAGRSPSPTSDDRPAGAQDLYYRAVDDANRLYSQPGQPGYQTDRGRTYVLYGPPAQTTSVTWAGLELESWLYTRYNLRFVFVRTAGGYHLL